MGLFKAIKKKYESELKYEYTLFMEFRKIFEQESQEMIEKLYNKDELTTEEFLELIKLLYDNRCFLVLSMILDSNKERLCLEELGEMKNLNVLRVANARLGALIL